MEAEATQAEPQQTASWEEVTPETAEAWLGMRHPRQRPLVPDTVMMYYREMTAVPCRFNSRSPQGLIFDEDGYLTDGQHRLAALTRAGVTFTFWVTRGAARDTMKVFDTGAKRTAGQRLHIDGVTRAGVTAAIARWDILWEQRQVWSRRYKISHEELAQRIAADPVIPAAAEYGEAWYQGRLLSRSQAGFLWLAFTKASDPRGEKLGIADDFLNAVRDGTGLEANDPRYVLRERLAKPRLAWKITDQQRARELRVILSVYAWNHWRRGNVITRLQLPDEISDATMVRPV